MKCQILVDDSDPFSSITVIKLEEKMNIERKKYLQKVVKQ